MIMVKVFTGNVTGGWSILRDQVSRPSVLFGKVSNAIE